MKRIITMLLTATYIAAAIIWLCAALMQDQYQVLAWMELIGCVAAALQLLMRWRWER